MARSLAASTACGFITSASRCRARPLSSPPYRRMRFRSPRAPLSIENTGSTPLRFLEVFRSGYYVDIPLAQWLALTPPELVSASAHPRWGSRFVRCPLLALSGHPSLQRTCPLSGVKRTWRFALHMSAFDPKRTFAKIGLRLSYVWCPIPQDARFLSDQGCRVWSSIRMSEEMLWPCPQYEADSVRPLGLSGLS